MMLRSDGVCAVKLLPVNEIVIGLMVDRSV